MIEKIFDVAFVGDLALREKQIQQNYRPIIGVHKWFARRPGTLFRGLLLSEFVPGPLRDTFYKSHSLKDITIADPFMGGGTPLVEANRLGCNIVGTDINPMAYWIVRQEVATLDIEAYRLSAIRLINNLKKQLDIYYQTSCDVCGKVDVPVKYFLWVKTLLCPNCLNSYDLYPGYLLSGNQRHPKNVLICPGCGELNEIDNLKNPGVCVFCSHALQVNGPAKKNKCQCPHCGSINKYPLPEQGPPKHRMVAIEYHCPHCKPSKKGRFFKKPGKEDIDKYAQTSKLWSDIAPKFAPCTEIIPAGDETQRLHRWGYKHYGEMFNDRQLLGLEMSCRAVDSQLPGEIRNALATNLSDLLRYQNMLCRYDSFALKSLDIFSIHGFPVGLVQCESNLMGITKGVNGVNVGSGGWLNIIDKYAKGKAYCYAPFEIRHDNGRKVQVQIDGEWIGIHRPGDSRYGEKIVDLHCASSTEINLPIASLDAVFTDPPYFANVQYAELMDFCYVWLRRLISSQVECFKRNSTRDENELTGNNTMERGLKHFTIGLSSVFTRMAKALKPGCPFAFTYHHNNLEAYFPVAVAILDAKLTCSVVLPCPAEMGASIHINGTASSIIDTIFVCRSTGVVSRKTIVSTAEDIAQLVRTDLEKLSSAKIKTSQGDIRCITFGHIIRLAIWYLRQGWNVEDDFDKKFKYLNDQVQKLGGWLDIKECLSLEYATAPDIQRWTALEEIDKFGGQSDEISF